MRGKPLADAAVRHNVLRNDTPAAEFFLLLGIRLFQSAADFIYLVNLCADALVHEDFRGIDCLIDHNAVCDDRHLAAGLLVYAHERLC